jgi:hypothetical protein
LENRGQETEKESNCVFFYAVGGSIFVWGGGRKEGMYIWWEHVWNFWGILSRFVSTHCRSDTDTKMTVSWVTPPCMSEEVDRRFRVAYCLHHKGFIRFTRGWCVL